MKKRPVFKNSGKHYRLSDDVTERNSKLIQRLSDHELIESAWYYNGRVFGKTVSDGNRIKFDLYDDIDQKVRSRRRRSER
ncbi:hypothetical protein FSP39_007062 [Pinctada imbricata]|uniref:Uncharacterized protein n=1 Tax=Pinctada imbricata TaxID=66713 RepID=A0AA89C337_PINIB|nr:hypothetical protein FSP39_007062 [Pinctada imbricata]